MFERFTDRSRRVLVLAQEETRLLNHNFIGTEHLLLGLLHESQGVGGTALTSLGVSLEAVRDMVAETIGPVAHDNTGSPPFTPRSKKVLELALREALQLGHNYIGTEHLLLGLVREGEGVGVQALHRLGADSPRIRAQVIALLAGHSGNPDYERPVIAGTDVEKTDVALKAEAVFGWKDAAALILEGPMMADTRHNRFVVDGIEYDACAYVPRRLAEFSVTVAGANVSREAFDRYATRWQPDATPVEDLGDAASYSAAARSVRVLTGGLVFVAAVDHHPEPRKMVLAAARRVLDNLAPLRKRLPLE